MPAGIDRTPDELFLQIFDGFTFNELRPVLGTCSRWRALGQACPAFWKNILTPRGSIAANLSAAISLSCTRMARTNGRNFTLHLHCAHAEVLSAAARHIHHVEHLEVQLAQTEEIVAVISTLNTSLAPRLRSFAIMMQDEDEYPSDSPPALEPNLFSGSSCLLLTRVWLSDIALPPSEVLPCFSSVTDLRLWSYADLLSPETPDLFLHFPALRRLSLSAPVSDIGAGFDQDQLEIINKFRMADYSRIEYIELLNDCWDLAEETAWPLENVPHVLAGNFELIAFPFLPPPTFARGHIVFEPREDVGACIIRFGNDDWTFSRGCASDPSSDLESRGIDAAVAEIVQTVSVPASLVPLARFVLDEASNLTTLRIIIGRGNSMPSTDGLYHLRCPNTRVLVLRGDFDPRVSARVDYDALVLFARSSFDSCNLPASLRLENVELRGLRPEAFATYFCDVQTQDPDSWSYANSRSMLNKATDW